VAAGVGEWGEGAIVFLASNSASFMNGALVDISGGRFIR
jgi:hypothetical protein